MARVSFCMYACVCVLVYVCIWRRTHFYLFRQKPAAAFNQQSNQKKNNIIHIRHIVCATAENVQPF